MKLFQSFGKGVQLQGYFTIRWCVLSMPLKEAIFHDMDDNKINFSLREGSRVLLKETENHYK